MPSARAPFRRGKPLSVFAITVVVCLTAGASCSSSESGLEVGVHLAAPASPALEDGSRHFESDQGYEVMLTRGYLAVGSVAIMECEAAAARAPLRLPFGTSVAFAHSMSSPTMLGEPGVIDLLAPAQSEFLLGT